MSLEAIILWKDLSANPAEFVLPDWQRCAEGLMPGQPIATRIE